MISRKIFLS